MYDLPQPFVKTAMFCCAYAVLGQTLLVLALPEGPPLPRLGLWALLGEVFGRQLRTHGGSIGAPFEEPFAQLRRRRLFFGSPSRAQRVEGVARAAERAVRGPADRVAQRRYDPA